MKTRDTRFYFREPSSGIATVQHDEELLPIAMIEALMAAGYEAQVT